MKKFLKNYWLFILLAFIASILVGLFFINKKGGGQEKLEKERLLSIPYQKFEEYQLKVSPNFNYLYNNFPSLPQREIVYEVTHSSFSEQEAIEIAKKFGFQNKPEFSIYNDKIFYDWKEPDKFLTINLSDGKIDFNNKDRNLITSPSIFLPNISEVDFLVKSILEEKSLLPKEEINLLVNDKSYLKLFDYEYGTTNNPKEAFAIQVKLQYQLKKIKILGADMTILIGNNNEILKLNYLSSFKTIKTLDSYPLKNKEEIIKNLKSLNLINYFEIINGYSFLEESVNIRKINFNKIEIVYIKNQFPQTNLQPIFFISGQAVLKDGTQTEVGIYLPAIQDKYLLK